MVSALALFDPAQLHERGDRLVDPLPAGSDHARQLFLSDRKREIVGLTSDFEQSFRCATGDIEEDRVGQHAVHVAEPGRQQLDDPPQVLRLVGVELPKRFVRNHDGLGRFECSTVRRAVSPVEERHFAEQIARLHQRDEGLPTVDRAIDHRYPPGEDDEQLGGRVVFAEQHIASGELPYRTGRRDFAQHVVAQVTKQLDRSDLLDVYHC